MKLLYSRSPIACYGIIGGIIILLVARYGIGVKEGGVYVSWHVNLGIGGRYEQMFYPSNDIGDNEGESNENGSSSVSPYFKPSQPDAQDEEFLSGLEALKGIVDKAAEDGKRLRAFGSRWAVTDIPYTQDYMIDTYGLNYVKIGIENDDDVTDYYMGERKEALTFVQCGVMVKNLYTALFREGLSLTTSMATDGQTIAGAVSTGSHDAAIYFGSIQEHVKGIHIVVPGKTVFIQKDKDRVLTEAYVKNTLKADELINSDAMFNAALVSFGTFGVVHGYLIQPEPLHRLKVEVRDFPLSEASDALYSLEPRAIEALGFDLDDPSELPWFMQAYLNPYRIEQKEGVRIRVMRKVAISEQELDEIKSVAASYTPTYYGRDLGLVMAQVVSIRMMEFVSQFAYGPIGMAVRRLFYGFTSKQTINALMEFAGFDGSGFPLELYGDPNAGSYFMSVPVSTNTMEVACPIYDLDEALPLILKELDEFPNPTSIDVRFTKSSEATLAPSGFGPYITAWMSLSSLDSPAARLGYERVYEALEENRESIDFRYHWGKALPENDKWVEKSFGPALDEWKTERAKLLSTPVSRYIFSSDFTDSLGITP